MKRLVARLFLALSGWREEGERPETRKFVLLAAPHTSNWDLVYLLALAALYGGDVSWMGKHKIFSPPFGGLMRRLGGIPIRRDRREAVVDQMARAFAERESLALVVPAEGTRGYVDHWKSGFYHIAQTARVPIVMGYLDYPRKRGGFGPTLVPTGDVSKDMDAIRDFYGDKVGKYPDLCGKIRLAEEIE
jgi:1-acyl-sn-glycerol-3-phosphate acyltransferase